MDEHWQGEHGKPQYIQSKQKVIWGLSTDFFVSTVDKFQIPEYAKVKLSKDMVQFSQGFGASTYFFSTVDYCYYIKTHYN